MGSLGAVGDRKGRERPQEPQGLQRSGRGGPKPFVSTARRVHIVLHGHIRGQPDLTYISLCCRRTDATRVARERTYPQGRLIEIKSAQVRRKSFLSAVTVNRARRGP